MKVLVTTKDHRMHLLDTDLATSISELGHNQTKFVYGNNNVVVAIGSFEQITKQIVGEGIHEQIKRIEEYRRAKGIDPNPVGTPG